MGSLGWVKKYIKYLTVIPDINKRCDDIWILLRGLGENSVEKLSPPFNKINGYLWRAAMEGRKQLFSRKEMEEMLKWLPKDTKESKNLRKKIEEIIEVNIWEYK